MLPVKSEFCKIKLMFLLSHLNYGVVYDNKIKYYRIMAFSAKLRHQTFKIITL